ncbi:MAG TPA: hypothetical protein VEV81_10945 [Pyrinomonadaceae bacterium]|nr:hypothetical protein [Pyrinomonadaceae bacterium]
MRKVLLIVSLAMVSLTMPVLAQTGTTTTTQGGGAQQQQTSQREVTTTTTTHTQTAAGIDPIWLVLGGIALLAILALVVLAARGRRSDGATHVHERTTVIKE